MSTLQNLSLAQRREGAKIDYVFRFSVFAFARGQKPVLAHLSARIEVRTAAAIPGKIQGYVEKTQFTESLEHQLARCRSKQQREVFGT